MRIRSESVPQGPNSVHDLSATTRNLERATGIEPATLSLGILGVLNNRGSLTKLEIPSHGEASVFPVSFDGTYSRPILILASALLWLLALMGNP